MRQSSALDPTHIDPDLKDFHEAVRTSSIDFSEVGVAATKRVIHRFFTRHVPKVNRAPRALPKP